MVYHAHIHALSRRETVLPFLTEIDVRLQGRILDHKFAAIDLLRSTVDVSEVDLKYRCKSLQCSVFAGLW